jgi:hypothetical protein
MDEALDGGLHEHEESVRRVRVALQSLTEELRTARSRAAGR